jgi:hypothetical protein
MLRGAKPTALGYDVDTHLTQMPEAMGFPDNRRDVAQDPRRAGIEFQVGGAISMLRNWHLVIVNGNNGSLEMLA